MSKTSTVSSSQETVYSSHNASAGSFSRAVVVVNRQQTNSGLLTWLCANVWCRRGRNDDDIVCKQTDTSFCSLSCVKHVCCVRGELPRSCSEVHRRDFELKDCRVQDNGNVKRLSHNKVSQCRGFCSHSDGTIKLQDAPSSPEKNMQCTDVVPHTSSMNTDTVARRKPPSAHCVMLGDAAYGHATALDDCLMSDSEGWSWRSLSNSRPNSTEAAGLGGMAAAVLVDAIMDDMYESYSGDEEDEDDAWQGVLALPVPPVYDQVKDPSANWSLALELKKLAQYGWYWGPITRVEAEEKLAGQDDGTFLVRDSSDDHYLLSLSFRSYGRTLHTRIEHCQGAFSLYAQSGSDGYKSIVELIERSIDDSRTGVFCYSRARALGSPSFPVRLTRPVSRFAQVRSLQYLCRFLIRQYTRVDHIRQLPLPTSIREWLEERPY